MNGRLILFSDSQSIVHNERLKLTVYKNNLFGYFYPKLSFLPNELRSRRINAIKLSLGEHAGSPLQPLNTWGLVGAYLRVCP